MAREWDGGRAWGGESVRQGIPPSHPQPKPQPAHPQPLLPPPTAPPPLRATTPPTDARIPDQRPYPPLPPTKEPPTPPTDARIPAQRPYLRLVIVSQPRGTVLVALLLKVVGLYTHTVNGEAVASVLGRLEAVLVDACGKEGEEGQERGQAGVERAQVVVGCLLEVG